MTTWQSIYFILFPWCHWQSVGVCQICEFCFLFLENHLQLSMKCIRKPLKYLHHLPKPISCLKDSAQKERNIFLLICHNCNNAQGNLTQPTWLSHDSNKNSCFFRETSCLRVLRADFSTSGQYSSNGIFSIHEKHKGFLKGGLQKLDHT